jgi:hypothetical protein
MKRLTLLAILVLATLPARLSAAEVAPGDGSFATPPPPVATVPASEAPASTLVRRVLLEPLAIKDREASKFTRGRLPARERRVRLPDPGPVRDARGQAFVRFAIDELRGLGHDELVDGWELAVISGCAYLDRGEVFVQKGEEFRPAALLLGKHRKAAPEPTCRAATSVARVE